MSNSNGCPLTWHDVTPSHPCPKCSKTSWCRLSDNGDWCICHNVAEGAYSTGKDKNGEVIYKHRLTPWPERAPRWPEPTVAMGGEKADDDILHKVYGSLLSKLDKWASAEIEELERRSIKGIAKLAGYRTLGRGRCNAVAKMIADGLEPHFPHVPGFVIREKNGRRYWSTTGIEGLVFPVRDHKGRIVKLMNRPSVPIPGKKYLALSSRGKKYNGPGAGNPVHYPLAPDVKDRSIVRITEGVIKADAATHFSKLYTIGLPGIGAWGKASALPRCVPLTDFSQSHAVFG